MFRTTYKTVSKTGFKGVATVQKVRGQKFWARAFGALFYSNLQFLVVQKRHAKNLKTPFSQKLIDFTKKSVKNTVSQKRFNNKGIDYLIKNAQSDIGRVRVQRIYHF